MRGTERVTIITQNRKMQEILGITDKIAKSDSSILLIGETGVGKEIFADYIHHKSARSQGTSVKIGLAAMPPDLMASELFGHEKGSFTSASETKMGLFEVASKGTIFLDDVDDIPVEIQSKLLRVLECRELTRIGGTTTIPVDIRLIAASKVDLNQLVKARKFRSDLFYRINVVTLEIPPLRQRRDDIPLLVEHFIRRYAPNRQLPITHEAMSYLMNYHWPGNIRELRNVVHRATLFAQKEITVEEISPEIKSNNPIKQIISGCMLCFNEQGMHFNRIMTCLEDKLITEALKRTEGNQSQAAKLLSLSLSTFRDKMKKYQINPSECQDLL
ncbi:MAG: sigma-54 dependent transcriptional regulator [Bacteroidota bacterium]